MYRFASSKSLETMGTRTLFFCLFAFISVEFELPFKMVQFTHDITEFTAEAYVFTADDDGIEAVETFVSIVPAYCCDEDDTFRPFLLFVSLI